MFSRSLGHNAVRKYLFVADEEEEESVDLLYAEQNRGSWISCKSCDFCSSSNTGAWPDRGAVEGKCMHLQEILLCVSGIHPASLDAIV